MWRTAGVLAGSGALVLAAAPAVPATPPPATAIPAADCRLKGSGPAASGVDPAVFHPARGTVAASMVFVDFPDHPADAADEPAGAFGASLTDFAARWLAENSSDLARLDVTYDDQWVRMSQPAAAYGFADGVTYDEHRAYIAEAVQRAGAAGFRFGDRELLYVVAAPTGGAIPQSPAWLGGEAGAVTALDGTSIEQAATTGDDVRETTDGFGAKVLAHETGHLFGLPDLYDYGADSFETLHRFAGAWDLMGNLAPGLHALAWHKLQLGWIDADEHVCVPRGRSAEVVVRPTTAAGAGTRALVAPTSASTAYVVEIRRPELLDSAMCDPGGAVVSHVDADVAGGAGPIRVLPDDPGAEAPCGVLAHAPYDVGDVLERDGVRIEVLAAEGDGLRVRVTNGEHAPPDPTVPCPRGTSATVVCTPLDGGGLLLQGTAASETLRGTRRDDVVLGDGGRDVLLGRGGRDTLVGEGRRDRFSAGGGRDRVDSSGQRRERVSCGGGRDRVVGARGDRVRRNCERVRRRRG